MNSSEGPSLTFLGAAGTVTGSRYLVEAEGRRILIDCGLFQGFKQLRLRNWNPFPVPPNSIDAVLLTHAHIDHSGYLPALVRDGFRGAIHCTPATAALCELLLPDCGHLQEEEARFALRHHYSRHNKPRPLYTAADATAALDRIKEAPFDHSLELGEGLSARFLPAGHLLGAAQIQLRVGGRTVHFTGDLGRARDVMMRPPQPFEGGDVLVCESTYGDRAHPDAEPEVELAGLINRTAARGGVVLIPAFAVGRAQAVMLQIAHLRERATIPEIPVYLNSPMAIDATEIYRRFSGEHRLSSAECRAMYQVAHRVQTAEESKALNRDHGPSIIISASGMLTGGRILHHLVAFGGDPKNSIALIGFQAGGTRGAALASGDRVLRIFGQQVEIRAEVKLIESMSGHADADEILGWLRRGSTPQMTYVTHGEPASSDALRFRIDHELAWPVRVPEHLEKISLQRPE